MNTIKLGAIAPNFIAITTEGEIDFHEWLGANWGVLFSHPKDFTPVCATELGAVAGLREHFAERNCKVIGLSVDQVEDHHRWLTDIEKISGHRVNFPLISDPLLEISKLYNMLPAEEEGDAEGRTAVNNSTVRSVYIIDPDKKIRLILTYPMTTGRNFQEILRTIDSMQLTDSHKVATPADWKHGDDVIIVPSMSEEDALKNFSDYETVVPYLRKTKQPLLS